MIPGIDVCHPSTAEDLAAAKVHVMNPVSIPLGFLAKSSSYQRRLMGALILGAFTATAVGESITYNASSTVRPYPNSQLLTVPKFDPGLGVLNSVVVQLDGTVRCSPRAENLQNFPRTITVGAIGTMEIFNANYTQSYLDVSAVVTRSVDVTAYDGVTDFAGPGGTAGSGFIIDPPLSAVATASLQFLPADSAFLDFVGSGELELGAMNDAIKIAPPPPPEVLTLISIDVGSALQVTYNYTPAGAAIGGTVWTDTNQNGNLDAGEPGTPGAVVTLLDFGLVPVNIANNPQTTGTSGTYLFTGLDVPGSDIFWVAVDPPPGSGGTSTSTIVDVVHDQYVPSVNFPTPPPDTTPPVCSTPLSITCPPSLTVPYNGAPKAATTMQEFLNQQGIISGACAAVTITSSDVVSGSCPVHITRTYTVTEGAPRNLVATCQQQITMNNLFKIGDIIWHQPLSRNGAADDTDPSGGGALKYRFKLDSTIPVQIHLFDCFGNQVGGYANVIGKVQVYGDANCNGIADGNDILIDYNGVGGASGLMDKVGPFLKYNLDTKKLKLPKSLACYILKVTVTDTSTGETVSENVPLQAK